MHKKNSASTRINIEITGFGLIKYLYVETIFPHGSSGCSCSLKVKNKVTIEAGFPCIPTTFLRKWGGKDGALNHGEGGHVFDIMALGLGAYLREAAY